MNVQPDPKPAKAEKTSRRPLGRTRIRSLRPGESPPSGEPKRYRDPRGYVRMRWKVGPCSYVETYEHRLDAGLPADPVKIAPPRARRFAPYRSRSAKEKAERNAARRSERLRFVAELVSLYRQGMTTLELAEAFGRDASNITRALQSAGVRGRTSSDYASPLDEDEVERLYVVERVSPDGIAVRLGAGAVRVRRILRERGVMRPSGRPRSAAQSYAQEFAEARPVVLARAGNLCEARLGGCEGKATHVHHRKLRSQGGQNYPSNLLAVCPSCHREIHRSPTASYDCGLLVRSFNDPALVPVGRYDAVLT